MPRKSIAILLLLGLASGLGACGNDDDGSGVAANAMSQCGVDKLDALAQYCSAYFAEGATAAELAQARAELNAAWGEAEAEAETQGLSCSDLALTPQQATDIIGESSEVLAAIAGGSPNGTDCAGQFFNAVGEMCEESLRAEGQYLIEQGSSDASSRLSERRESARRDFLPRSDKALAMGCVDGGEEDVQLASNAARAETDQLVDELYFDVVAAANVDQDQYITLTPPDTVDYEGRAFNPVCMDGSQYHFFARRGTVNNLVVYYQGGGACWDKLTCSVATCDTNVNPDGGDNPNNRNSGFANLNNPMNPFRNWNSVFVSYCGCDIHFGDAEQDYVNGPDDTQPLHVEHRGYENAQVVEKWAREHFLAPDTVFVTGSSAGAYGAWFHAPLLHDVWPNAQFQVLADAGNGVITQEFLDESFPNWNFEANLPPDMPAIQQVLDDGSGIPGYTEVVAKEFPDTNWAQYTTAYDGGTGGQTGFYNIMLNDNEPVAALTWWEGSCQFNTVMREQSFEIAGAVADNYRYYIGTGSRHTIWGSNKVYGVENPDAPPAMQKITDDPDFVDWVNAMLASDGESRDPDWVSFECDDCGLVLPGDPQPSPVQDPFFMDGDDVVIVCD